MSDSVYVLQFSPSARAIQDSLWAPGSRSSEEPSPMEKDNELCRKRESKQIVNQRLPQPRTQPVLNFEMKIPVEAYVYNILFESVCDPFIGFLF